MRTAAMPTVFDLTYVETLTDGDNALKDEMLRTFIEDTRKNVTQLEALVCDGLNNEWVDIAHILKGSARSVGAEELFDVCMRAQCANSNETTADERRNILREINQASIRLIDSLENYVL